MSGDSKPTKDVVNDDANWRIRVLNEKMTAREWQNNWGMLSGEWSAADSRAASAASGAAGADGQASAAGANGRPASSQVPQTPEDLAQLPYFKRKEERNMDPKVRSRRHRRRSGRYMRGN